MLTPDRQMDRLIEIQTDTGFLYTMIPPVKNFDAPIKSQRHIRFQASFPKHVNHTSNRQHKTYKKKH